MTVLLPIAETPLHAEPTSVTIPRESHTSATFETVPLDEGRWDAWRAKGRAADAAFAEKMRSVALMGMVVAGAVAAFWIGFD